MAWRRSLSLLFALSLTACVTTGPLPEGQPTGTPNNDQSDQTGGASETPSLPGQTEPAQPNPTTPPVEQPYQPPAELPTYPDPSNPTPIDPPVPTYPSNPYPSDSYPSDPYPSVPTPPDSPFYSLLGWSSVQADAGLTAFKRTCDRWETRPQSSPVSAAHPVYGTLGDWQSVCFSARYAVDGRSFFEREFYPIRLTPETQEAGLMTGYFQPEIDVRLRADATYSEPILAVPTDSSVTTLPRAQINANSSRIIAYGRPIDVFFMQIQGSGLIRYETGQRIRAAYAANNGHAYKSIGRVLVDRGEMTLEQASKQSIENWMVRAGPVETRKLMNENPRYIFFKEEAIVPGEGPVGAMQVPLTAMGSVAVDPNFHPYGAPIFIYVKTPQVAGDYRGVEAGHILVAQDTGKAIKGAMRGDVYFGTGADAGARAGVMKHRGSWTVLLPISLATRLAPSQ